MTMRLSHLVIGHAAGGAILGSLGGLALFATPMAVDDRLVVTAVLTATTAVGAAITAFILLSIEAADDEKGGRHARRLEPCRAPVKVISRQ